MKVVQINAIYGSSSVGRTVAEMHEFLVEHGIESYVFYSVKNKESDAFDIIGNKLDHKIHGFFSRLFGKQAYFSYLPTRKLISKLERIKPNVVILRNFHSNYINMPLLLAYLANEDIATIVVLHDCWFFTGHCCHYTEIGCDKWQVECHHCPLIKTNNKSWLLDNSRSIFNDKQRLFGAIPRLAVVGVSDWITNEGRKSPIFGNTEYFQRIYNWIDFNKFYFRENAYLLREKLGVTSDDFVALAVSMQWDDRKGLNVIIKLAETMSEIKIVLVGNCSSKQLPSNVILCPPTGSVDQLAEYYSMADVFLNFSIQETFGKVTAEALACGTPAVVNNATANPEIPGSCGEVVNTNDINAVVEVLKRIRINGKEYYSARCVERAHELFDKDKNIMQYLQLFSRITKRT